MAARVVSTRTHGALDYVTGTALLVAPELLRLMGVRSSARAPRLAGAAATGSSLMTDYELGAVRVLPMRAHLALDAAAGALLAASPWLFRYARHGKRYWVPHALVGSSELLLALTTETEPRRSRARGRRLLLPALGLAAAGAGVVAARRRRRPSFEDFSRENGRPSPAAEATEGRYAERFLVGLSYPAGKEDVIRHVEEQGAGAEVVSWLGGLPERRFEREEELSRAIDVLGPLEPAGADTVAQAKQERPAADGEPDAPSPGAGRAIGGGAARSAGPSASRG